MMMNNENEGILLQSRCVVFTRVGIRDFRFRLFGLRFEWHSNFLVPGNNLVFNQVSNKYVY